MDGAPPMIAADRMWAAWAAGEVTRDYDDLDDLDAGAPPAWNMVGEHAAELERVLGPDRVLYPHAARRSDRYGAGEWDTLYALPARVKRQLSAARLLTRDGIAPDVAADRIVERVPGVDGVDAAMDWYVATCRALLRARQEDRSVRLSAARPPAARSARFRSGVCWFRRAARLMFRSR